MAENLTENQEFQGTEEEFASPWAHMEEFFPGYKAGLTSITAEKYKTGKELEDVAGRFSSVRNWSNMAKNVVTSLEHPKGMVEAPFRLFASLFSLPFPWDLINFARNAPNWQADIDRATSNYNRASWKQTILSSLPYVLADTKGGISSIDDVLQRFPNSDISDADRAWLEDVFTQLEYIKTSAGEVPTSPEEVRAIIEQSALPKPVTVHQLATQEIIKAFKTGVTPTLPTGLTEDELLESMRGMGLSEEEQAEVTDIHIIATQLQEDWAQETAWMEMMRQGLMNPEVDELTFGQTLKMTFTQPALATLELFEKYYHHVVRPIAGYTVYGLDKLFSKDPAIEALYNQFRDEGENSWEAMAMAYEEWDANWALKLFLEVVFDPTTYIGFGIATKLTKGMGVVGRFVGAVEKGWLEMWDLPFKAIRRGMKLIPKTPGQAAAQQARNTHGAIRAAIKDMTKNKTLIGTVPDQLKELGDYFIDLARARPWEIHNSGVRAGLATLETAREFIDDVTLKRWITKVGANIDITPAMLQDSEFLFDLFFRKALNEEEVAGLLLINVLGVEITDDSLKTMVKMLGDQADIIVTKARRLWDAETTKGLLDKMYRETEEIFIRKYESKMYKFALQGGRVTGWSRFIDRVVRNSTINWIDRHITMPIANQYLMFANYGPFNVVESAMRSFMGGGEMFYPRLSSPVDELVRVGADLTNLPFEFVQLSKAADIGLGRLEMAIVNPRTGQPVAYKKGIIPYITRDGPKGFTIRIGNKNYTLKSWQNWNDMFGDIGGRQRAWYFLTKFKQTLNDVAPEEMKAIATIMDNARPLLDHVKSLSKAEIDDIARVTGQDALVSIEAVLAHDLPLSNLENQRALMLINKVMDSCPEIFHIHKNWIREGTITGTIFRDLDGSKKAIEASIKEFSLAGLEGEIRKMNKLVSSVISNQPKSFKELVDQMNAITGLFDAIDNKISDVRKITTRRSAELLPDEKMTFHSGTWDQIMRFLDTVETDLDYMMDIMKRQVMGVDFSTDWTKIDMTGMKWAGFDFTENAKDLINKLPLDMRGNIKKVTFDKTIAQRGAIGSYDPIEQIVKIADPKYLKTYDGHNTLVHEFMHGHSAMKWDLLGDFQFMDDFLKIMGYEGTPQMALTRRAAQESWSYQTYYSKSRQMFSYDKTPEEMLAREFGIYAANPSAYQGPAKRFFESHMPLKLSNPKIPVNKVNAVMDLLDNSHKRIQALISTREAERSVAERLLASKPRFKSPDEAHSWWKSFYEQRDVPWSEFRNLDAQLYKRQLSLNKFITPPTKKIPALPPILEGELTPAHIAYIFGTTGDGLSRGLVRTETMTMLPREKFIIWVSAEAEDIARRVGKKAADIGFTDEAIGKCYDQMLRSIGIDPSLAAKEPMIPALSQLDNIFQELERIKATKAIPESDALALKRYFNQIAADLADTPMYRGKVHDLSKIEYSGGAEILQKQIEGILNDLPPEIANSVRKVRAIKGKIKEGLLGGQATIDGFLDFNVSIPRKTLEDTLYDTIQHEANHIYLLDLISSGNDDLVKRIFGTYNHNSDDVARIMGLTGDDRLKEFIKVYRSQLEDISEHPQRLYEFLKAEPAPGASVWKNLKEDAMIKTRKQYELDFTDYETHNAVDAAMRNIFPFWTYEWQRWFWLPRTWLQHPGTATALGKYMNYSDSGYMPIPGTDVQFNPLRGTVFMGGFRRLQLRDYPEYYDAFPGMEMLDYIGRMGFYPGINVMAPIVGLGALRGRPEWGELMPAWIKTGFNAATAVAPPEVVAKVTEHLFPDRFRNYLTILTLNADGYDGLDLWNKMKNNQLSPDEAATWGRAIKKATGLKGILFEQGGIFRLRPEEYTQFIEDSQKLLEEMTGIPVETQKVINRRYPVTGQRLSDLYPLNILQQKILYETEMYRNWQGVTTPLFPSSWQEEDRRVREYYTNVEGISNDARNTGLFDHEGNLLMPSIKDINRMLIEGTISPDQWIGMRGDLMSRVSTAINELGERAYPDVPKTLEEREARLAERGIASPVFHPDEELMMKYFELMPQWRYDWEAGKYGWDFDTYYAMTDAILEALQDPYRQVFVDRIQYEWTPMERLYWDVSREYLRPYRLVRNIILDKYPPELQQAIRRYEVAQGAEREALLEIVDPATGNKLISQFTTQLREARINLRRISPTLDAWLNFWGITTTFQSTLAEEQYNQLRETYLTESMVE